MLASICTEVVNDVAPTDTAASLIFSAPASHARDASRISTVVPPTSIVKVARGRVRNCTSKGSAFNGTSATNTASHPESEAQASAAVGRASAEASHELAAMHGSLAAAVNALRIEEKLVKERGHANQYANYLVSMRLMNESADD